MKRVWKIALLLGVLTLLLCAVAFAADEAGIYDLTQTGATVTPQKADGTAVTATATTIGGQAAQVYVDAAKLKVEVNSSASYVLIVMQTGTDAPTEETIRYIDQQAPTDGKATFTVYPIGMKKGETYNIYVAEAGGTSRKLVASFKYNQSYILGDVDGNGAINSDDSLLILQHTAKIITLDATQQLAADADGNGAINSDDSLLVLQYTAKIINSFDT